MPTRRAPMPTALLLPIEEASAEPDPPVRSAKVVEQGPTLEPLLHPDAVARLLGVGRRTLRRLAASRELPAVEVRGSVRYRPSDVEKYISRGK